MPSKKFRIVHRIPNSNILIDYWKPVSQEKYHRFMTFLKIDTNESIKDICESTYTIYTSLFNKWYLITYYQVSEHRLIDIRPNETINIYDAPSGTTFSVTAFDANYYTGSLMFLFRGSFGNVLYTGFFRPCSLDPILRNPVLKAVINKRELDVAFIDNTYAAEHCDFPTRKEVLNQIVTCLKQHPNHEVSISGKRLGKEEILLEIAKALDEKIWVTEEKFVILSRLNVQNHFTTDKNNSRIYACDYIINPKQCMRRQALGAQIIILLTAYYQCADAINKEDLHIPNLHIFPYSGHCSHPELKRFISYLRPREIQPIIKFEDSALPNSIIPQSLYELCSMPPPPTYSRFNNDCCKCRLDLKGMTLVTPINASSSICDPPAEKNIAARVSTNEASEIKYLDNIDEFLKTVAETNNASNFQNTSDTTNTSYQSPSNDLNRSIIDDILADPQTSNVSFYTEVTTDDDSIISNSIVVSNVQQASPTINDPISNNPAVNNFPDAEIMQMLNERNFSVAENIVPEFTAMCSPGNENIISTSSPMLGNTIIGMNLTEALPQNTVYSSYTESVIAENIISSTNNDNLSDMNFSSPETIVERSHEEVTSPKTAIVNLNARIDVDPLDLLKEDAHVAPVAQMNMDIIEKDSELIYTKTYDTKSTQTDLTTEMITQLEDRADRNERHLDEIIKQRVMKCTTLHKDTCFNTNKYYKEMSLQNIKHGTESNCKIENCQECKIAVEQEHFKMKRKLINLTLYSRTKIRKKDPIEEKLKCLNSCDSFRMLF